ncbi:hypothetical protein Hanom_Chr07g00647291 [Helianthus anomalus]
MVQYKPFFLITTGVPDWNKIGEIPIFEINKVRTSTHALLIKLVQLYPHIVKSSIRNLVILWKQT